MEKSLLSLLQGLLENHLIPTIGSIFLTILVILIFPQDWIIVQRLGRWGLGIGVFCFFFLAIYLVNVLRNKNRLKNFEKQRNKQVYDMIIEQMMTFYDHCKKRQLDLSYRLLNNNNTPVDVYWDPWLYDNDPAWTKMLDYTELDNGFFRVRFKSDFYDLLSDIYSKNGSISHFAMNTSAINRDTEKESSSICNREKGGCPDAR